MAFTVGDFQDLLRLLRDHPEWQAELRRHVLSDEVLQLPARVGRPPSCPPDAPNAR